MDLGPAFNPVDPNLPPCPLNVSPAQSQSLQTCVATPKHWDDSSTDEDSESPEPTTESPLTQGVDLAHQYKHPRTPAHTRVYTTSLRDLETEAQAQQLAVQNAKLQPVQTRAQARKDGEQAQQEADLALNEFFGGIATEPRLSGGVSTESPSPAAKTVQETTKDPQWPLPHHP